MSLYSLRGEVPLTAHVGSASGQLIGYQSDALAAQRGQKLCVLCQHAALVLASIHEQRARLRDPYQYEQAGIEQRLAGSLLPGSTT